MNEYAPVRLPRIFASVLFALTLGLPGCGASAESLRPDVRFQVEYYRVTGRSMAEIQSSIGEQTPSKEGSYFYAGVTVWDLNSSFDLVSSSSGCSLSNGQVFLNTTIHLPQLADSGHLSEGVRAEWTRFSNALKTHEMLHAKNAYRAATTLLSKIHGLRTKVPCERARTIIQKGTDELIWRISEFDRELDSQTQHGKTQGAYLDLDVQ
jgi:predicted secreted Zn-dependent protease